MFRGSSRISQVDASHHATFVVFAPNSVAPSYSRNRPLPKNILARSFRVAVPSCTGSTEHRKVLTICFYVGVLNDSNDVICFSSVTCTVSKGNSDNMKLGIRQRVRQQTVSQQPRDLVTYQMPDPSNKKENAIKTEMKRFSSITSYLQNPPCQAELTLRNNFFPNCCVALNMPRKF
ncbi:hypothetical protein OUZ56_022603 [Daphnia magna]|uniref:Uncharacterized protein n=1 Tax=Daphnia magna TaxID=35525 RepID=A0ABR0AWW6_9CRUS|nr:hypothetical protein OUZ56_022603 [Daphnia magna]